MGKWALKDIEAQADKILRTYFCESDVEFLISTFAEDIVWLGAGEKQKAEGREAVEKFFRVDKDEMMAFEMSGEEYVTRELGSGIYLCECLSDLQTKNEILIKQRITFIFREKEERLETVHIHNSTPFSMLQEGELFPIDAAKKHLIQLKDTLHQKNLEYDRQTRFLEQLYNTVPCGIVQFMDDEDYRIVNVNRMGWQMYGYSSEEEYRKEIKGLLQLLTEKNKPRIKKIIKNLSEDGKIISYIRDGYRKNGTRIWISVFMARVINTDGLEVVQAVYTDITEMRKMEEAQERERMIENSSLRAAICTAYPLILSVNLTKDTYNFFIEKQSSNLIKCRGTYSSLMESVQDRIHPSYEEDFLAAFSKEAIIRRFQSGEREIYMEFRQKGGDGQYHWYAVHVIYVENPFNDDIIAIELAKNLDKQVTEQARQEQLLRDALASAKAANRAKSDFLSRMSHDIRTPMNAIIGMTTIGQIKDDDIGGMKDCFKKIDISSRYLLSLINDILDMSKIETGKMEIAREHFDLMELIEEINQIMFPQANTKGIQYEVYHKEPLDRYYIGDALRIKQIMMNLLSNALKFTPEGGRVDINIEEHKRTNGFSYLKFTIRDTGIGMSEEFKGRVFQPFEQESQEGARNNVGSGLGLSIVYNLAQLMGGNVEVKSKKEKGTTFDVTIPLQLVTDDYEKEWERKRRELFKDLDVLVVDDDPIIGSQTAVILDDIGANTVWVDSGFKAIEEVKRVMQTQKLYDVAMIDWKMPDMDGVETARRIRKLVGPDTMIIMISAYDWSSIELEAKKAGVDKFIAKPLFRSCIYEAFANLESKEAISIEKPEKADLSRCCILLVEDNDLNREIAGTLLEMYDIKVETARDGKQAVDIFSARQPDYYHAILMDIRMPVMDGLEATKAIRRLDRKDAGTVPILAMTANAFEEDKMMAMSAGMNGYLVKPLDIRHVLETLREFII